MKEFFYRTIAIQNGTVVLDTLGSKEFLSHKDFLEAVEKWNSQPEANGLKWVYAPAEPPKDR